MDDNVFQPWEPLRSPDLQRLPLWTRRLAAGVLEAALVVASAAVPYAIGAIANRIDRGEPVSLHPALVASDRAFARAFGWAREDKPALVAPFTNLFWSIALVAPLSAIGWQTYLLRRKGQTLPKQWLRVQIVAATGKPPGWGSLVLREGSRWGLPFAIAYFLWRAGGAFPALGIWWGLYGMAIAAMAASAALDPQRRPLYDRWARTYVLEAVLPNPRLYQWNVRVYPPDPRQEEWDESERDAAIAAIVLSASPKERRFFQHLKNWMVRRPGTTVVAISLTVMGAILATFVGTQIYVQGQTNQRAYRERDNEMFLALVRQLSPATEETLEERRDAILALGAIEDDRAVSLLVDLLGQENRPVLLDALQQTLTGRDARTLRELHRSNLALSNQLSELHHSASSEGEQTTIRLRHRATKRAIANTLAVWGRLPEPVDLSRVDLGRSQEEPATFALVWDRLDLSGLVLRGATLQGGSFEGSTFASPGSDGRLGTFDDAIADLGRSNLQQANLQDAFLGRVVLERAKLQKARLDRADLTDARLRGANLSGANLLQAVAIAADLPDALLTGATLTQTNLSDANLRGVAATQVLAAEARFADADLSKSNWQEADLEAADFSGANLQNARLDRARLQDANLSGANLQNANLRGADLAGARLQGARLAGADFEGVRFRATEPAGDFIEAPEEPVEGAIADVNFSRVKNLDDRQIEFICQQGGIHPDCR